MVGLLTVHSGLWAELALALLCTAKVEYTIKQPTIRIDELLFSGYLVLNYTDSNLPNFMIKLLLSFYTALSHYLRSLEQGRYMKHH